jgi:hypothetical protein
MDEVTQLLEELMTLSVMSRLEGKDTSKLDVIIEKHKHLYKPEA